MKQDLERLQYILNRLKAEAGEDRSCSTCDVFNSTITKYAEEAISIVDRLIANEKQTAETSVDESNPQEGFACSRTGVCIGIKAE